MVSEKKKLSTHIMIDPTVQSILFSPNKVMPGFSTGPVVKFELVRNW